MWSVQIELCYIELKFLGTGRVKEKDESFYRKAVSTVQAETAG